MDNYIIHRERVNFGIHVSPDGPGESSLKIIFDGPSVDPPEQRQHKPAQLTIIVGAVTHINKMSLRPSFRVACRALAMRSRPALPRHETLTWSLQNRRYADDATQKPPSAQQASSTVPGTQPKAENASDVSDARMEQQVHQDTRIVGSSSRQLTALQRKAMEELVSQTSPEDVMDQLEAALRDLPAGEEAPTVEVV